MTPQPNRVIKRTQTANRYWPNINDLPYRFLTGVTFIASCGAMTALSAWVTGEWDTAVVFGLVVGGFSAALGVNVFLNRALSHIYQLDHIEEETITPQLPPLPPVRITHNGRTTEIYEPERGAFARWAREVLTQSKTYFSQNQAKARGFDSANVIGQLAWLGIVERKPSDLGVHKVTASGKRVLEEWLG